MSRLVDPTICPDCRAPLSAAAVCPACGLDLSSPTATELWKVMQQADQLITTMRSEASRKVTPARPSSASLPTAPRAVTPLPPAPAAPAPSRPRSRYLAPVPLVLLTLGGLALLVAVLLFAAATWSLIGMTARTVILFAVTVLVAGVAVIVTRRNLPAASETLWSVAAALIPIVLGVGRVASAFGLDRPTTDHFIALVGAVVAVGAVLSAIWAYRTTGRTIHTLSAASATGGLLVLAGLPWAGDTPAASLIAVPVLVAIGTALLNVQREQGLVALGLAGLAWCGLVIQGGVRLGEPAPTGWPQQTWLADLYRWPLLAAAGFAIAVALAPRVSDQIRRTAATGALVAFMLLAFGTYGSATPDLVKGTIFVTAFAATSAFAPPLWSNPAALITGFGTGVLTVFIADRWLNSLGGPVVTDDFTAAAWTTLPAGIAGTAGAVAFARALRRWKVTSRIVPIVVALAPASVLIGLALAVTGSGAATGVSMAGWIAATLAAGAGTLRSRNDRWGIGVASTVALLTADTAIAVLPLEAKVERLTMTSVAALVVLVALLLVRPTANRVTLTAVGLTFGTLALASSSNPEWTDLAAIVLGVSLVVPALVRASDWPASWLAVPYLAFAVGLRAVDHPVPKTFAELPALIVGAFLIVAGIHRLVRESHWDSPRMLASGTTLALAPSLLGALAQPTSTRGVIVAVAGVALLGAGVATRWLVPFVAGAVTVLLLSLRHLVPLIAEIPPWAYWPLSGAVGIVLLTVGITWESRVREVRSFRRYLAAMR